MARFTFHIRDKQGVPVASATRDCPAELQARQFLSQLMASYRDYVEVDVWREDEALFRYYRQPTPIFRPLV
jgi:hypothetical protein